MNERLNYCAGKAAQYADVKFGLTYHGLSEQVGFLCKPSEVRGTAELGLHRPHATDVLVRPHLAAYVFVIITSPVCFCQGLKLLYGMRNLLEGS